MLGAGHVWLFFNIKRGKKFISIFHIEGYSHCTAAQTPTLTLEITSRLKSTRASTRSHGVASEATSSVAAGKVEGRVTTGKVAPRTDPRDMLTFLVHV